MLDDAQIVWTYRTAANDLVGRNYGLGCDDTTTVASHIAGQLPAGSYGQVSDIVDLVASYVTALKNVPDLQQPLVSDDGHLLMDPQARLVRAVLGALGICNKR